MKSTVYCIVLAGFACISGCEEDSAATQKAMARAEKAEQKVIALQEAIAILKDEKTDENLNSLQVEDELVNVKDALKIATQAIVDLEAEKMDLEHKLKVATSTAENLRKELVTKDRDIKELDKLNLDLSEALEQLEKELQSIENNAASPIVD